MRKTVLLAVVAFSLASASAQNIPNTAEDYFNAGLERLSTKDYESAVEAFEKSSQLAPNRAATYANQAAAYVGLRQLSQAERSYRKAISINKGEGSFHTALCQVLRLEHDRAVALAECREGVRLAPDSAEANAGLITVLDASEFTREQIAEQVEGIAARFAESLPVLESAGRFYADVGDPRRAIAFYQHASALSPRNTYYLGVLAELCLRTNQEPAAVEYARRALAIDPDDPVANFFMGKLFLELGLNSDASDSFRRAAEGGSAEQIQAEYYLAVAEERLGHYRAALDAIRRAAVSDVGDFVLQKQYASVLQSLRIYPAAIDQYKLALRIKPTDVEARVGLALAYFDTSKYSEAIAILEPLARERPDDKDIVGMLLGVARARLEDIPRIAAVEEQVAREPKNIEVRAELIHMLSFAGRRNEMDLYADEVWKLGPKDPTPVVTIAVAYSEAGEKDKALDAYQRALAIGDAPSALLGLARIYSEKGEIENAIKYYEKALAKKPDSPGVMKLFADLLRDNGKRAEALAMYRRSLALKPANAPALFNAAMLSLKLGDPIAARSYLEQLRPLEPKLAAQIDLIIRLKLWSPAQ